MRVKELVDRYVAEGCRDGGNIPHKDPTSQQKLLHQVVARIGRMAAADVCIPTCFAYAKRRGARRVTELELSALSRALSYGVAVGWIPENRIRHGRPRLVDPEEVRRSKEVSPVRAEEITSAATRLAGCPQSAVLAWQLLFEACSGLRTIEAIRTEWMPSADTSPGFILGGRRMRVCRAKRGVGKWIPVTEELGAVVAGIGRWRDAVGIESKWMFPGRSLSAHVHRDSLTRALERVGDRKVTSHGLRAWFVTVARSHGRSEAEIAALIGDSTVSVVAKSYGGIPESWLEDPDSRVPMQLLGPDPAGLVSTLVAISTMRVTSSPAPAPLPSRTPTTGTSLELPAGSCSEACRG